MLKHLNLDQAQRYCVFESHENWFGIPALQLRGVIPCPTITPIPHSDPVVVGVCHVHNEFMPIISLRSLLDLQYESQTNDDQQVMLVTGPTFTWGLMIDRAIGLTPLEVSITMLLEVDDSWSKVVMGSATYSNQVLQVLDPDAIYQYAATLLNRYWSDAARFEIEASFCE